VVFPFRFITAAPQWFVRWLFIQQDVERRWVWLFAALTAAFVLAHFAARPFVAAFNHTHHLALMLCTLALFGCALGVMASSTTATFDALGTAAAVVLAVMCLITLLGVWRAYAEFKSTGEAAGGEDGDDDAVFEVPAEGDAEPEPAPELDDGGSDGSTAAVALLSRSETAELWSGRGFRAGVVPRCRSKLRVVFWLLVFACMFTLLYWFVYEGSFLIFAKLQWNRSIAKRLSIQTDLLFTTAYCTVFTSKTEPAAMANTAQLLGTRLDASIWSR
jgi:hypothetical protein